MNEVAVRTAETYLKNCPKKYAFEAKQFIDYALEHDSDPVDPESWEAYMESLRHPQTEGRMKGRIYGAAAKSRRLDAIINRMRYFYNHSNLSEEQKQGIEYELKTLRKNHPCKRRKPDPKFLQPKEVEKLIKGTEPDLSLMILFLWRTGVRVSEMCHLTLRAVTRDNGHVTATFIGKKDIEHGITFETAFFNEIRDHFKSKLYLFETAKGRPYHRSDVSMRIRRASIRLIGRPSSAHQIRHSVATYLYGKTKDVMKVSLFLGHSDPAITARTYIHSDLKWEEQKQLLDEAFSTKTDWAKDYKLPGLEYERDNRGTIRKIPDDQPLNRGGAK